MRDNLRKFERPPQRDEDYWICACVKRKGGKLTHIKANHRSIAMCKKCGCSRDGSEPQHREVS